VSSAVHHGKRRGLLEAHPLRHLEHLQNAFRRLAKISSDLRRALRCSLNVAFHDRLGIR
jgi:hypothetical protein